METRIFTVKEVFEALKKNGFEHLRENWFAWDTEGKLISACALGQAAINLSTVVSWHDHYDRFERNNFTSSDFKHTLVSQLNKFIVKGGKRNKWVNPTKKFLKTLGTEYCPPDLGTDLGDLIIGWNDAKAKDNFLLQTYEEVTNMAYELMEPFFDKTVELVVAFPIKKRRIRN